MRIKVLLSVLVLFSLLASCNMPAGQVPVTQPPENKPVSLDAEAIGTAVELTAAAKFAEMADSVTTTPTATSTPIPTATFTLTSAAPAQCNPTVTATVNANVRSGPSTDYDVVGALNLGQSATIVGRNDAYTWWYIEFPAAAGAHAWVAGTVVSSACVPSVVQVVAAPPLPTATSTEVVDNNLQPLLPLKPLPFKLVVPDLTVANMVVQPSVLVGVATEVKVKVKNAGNADAGSFTVQWWAGSEVGCSWSVNSLAVDAAKTLTCSYAFPSAGEYTVKTVVDAGATIAESNENNNTSQETVQASKLLPLKPKLPPIIQP